MLYQLIYILTLVHIQTGLLLQNLHYIREIAFKQVSSPYLDLGNTDIVHEIPFGVVCDESIPHLYYAQKLKFLRKHQH